MEKLRLQVGRRVYLQGMARMRWQTWPARAGVGVAPLPTALGDAEPDLVRVIEPVAELTRIWRVLTTPALRRTPRVSAFFEFVVAESEILRPIITG